MEDGENIADLLNIIKDAISIKESGNYDNAVCRGF
jgi:hypothetical protein